MFASPEDSSALGTPLLSHNSYRAGNYTNSLTEIDRLPSRGAGDLGACVQSERRWPRAFLVRSPYLRKGIPRASPDRVARTFSGAALPWPGFTHPFAHEDFYFVSC